MNYTPYLRVKRQLVGCILLTIFFTSYYFFHVKYVMIPPNHMRHFINRHRTEHFDGFDFDRENWTVRMTAPELNRESKRQLLVLRNEEKVVKRIIHSNGSVENLGCSNVTRRCKNVMQFDSKHMVRINTPPCCRESLLAILKHFTQEFRRLGVNHYLADGGLIGWIRYGEMIPYDLDFDLFVDERFWNTDLFKKTIKKMEDVYGHVTSERKHLQKLWVAYSATNKNHIDVWPYKKAIIHGEWKVFIPRGNHAEDQSLSTVFPLKNTSFGDLPMYIPNDPVAFLDEQYGKGNWEEEISCQHVVNGKCLEYPTTLYRLFGIY